MTLTFLPSRSVERPQRAEADQRPLGEVQQPRAARLQRVRAPRPRVRPHPAANHRCGKLCGFFSNLDYLGSNVRVRRDQRHIVIELKVTSQR